jgi:ankyrin repeat protein
MLAAMKGYLNTVKMLLNEKADTTIRNKNGENAYSLAVNTKHPRTAELISQHAKRQNIQSKEKEILKQPTKKN